MKHRLIKFSVPSFSEVLSPMNVDRRVLYLNVFMTNRSIKSVYTVNENNSNGCSDLLTQSAVNVTDLRDSCHGHQYVGSIKCYTDLEWSAVFYNELQKRPNLMKGNETVTQVLLVSSKQFMKTMNV